jgi:hypothetical protein
LLTYRSPRAANFTDIVIAENLARRGDTWWLHFQDGKSTNAEPWECRWPEPLVDGLERYLAVHRKVLLQSDRRARASTNALWISKQGSEMTAAAVSAQVRARTNDAFGDATNMHRFRHITATTIATDTPEHVGDLAPVLWHGSNRPAEKYYNQASQLEASRRYSALLSARGTRK